MDGRQVLVVVLTACLAEAASAQVVYRAVDLGTLGGTGGIAYAVNESGTIVGSAQWTNGEMHAFIWSNGVMSKLLAIDGMSNSHARDINEYGHIVGYYDATGGYRHSYLWKDGAYTNLTMFPGGRTSAVWAVNDYDQSVGHSHHPIDAEYPPRAFSWTTNGSTTIHPFDNLLSSEARGVNNSGAVVGFAFRWGNTHPYYFHWHPFIWQDTNANGLAENEEKMDMGTFGGFSGEAYDINESGMVAGKAMLADFSTFHAFLVTPRNGLWDDDSNGNTLSNSYMVDLGTLGGVNSEANGLNDCGYVVGDSDTAQTNRHAFLFDGVVLWDLNSLIDTNSGWVLTDAEDINSAGIIVGAGIVSGRQAAVALEPIATNYIRITLMRWQENSGTSAIDIGWSAWGSNLVFTLESSPNTTSGVWTALYVTNQCPAAGRMWRDTSPLVHTERYFRVRGLAD
jgi:probable HAF family extracellular repeat protein